MNIYIHIPFCKSRCIYCGFYSTTALELRQRYVDAVCREMELRKDYFSASVPVDSIYLGGGTPSQLTPDQLGQLFDSIFSVYGRSVPFPFSVGGRSMSDSNNMEITTECNPDDVTADYASALSQLPVNRVSMGVQTFDDARLRFLHRRHTAMQVPIAVQRLRDAGILNISIDLMYGFPGQTLADWQRDIENALRLGVEHLSAYCLMVEEGTPLCQLLMARSAEGSLLSKGNKNGQWSMDEELELQMYELLIDRLKAAGYEHYEISNFAKPGFRSRHNSSYWTDVPYIGLGAAAHSYDGHSRQWNVSDIHKYMEGIERGTLMLEREELDDDTRYNDRLTVALRTCEGLWLGELSSRHADYLLTQARKYIEQGLLLLTDDHLRLTRRGLFVSDMIMSDLMWV